MDVDHRAPPLALPPRSDGDLEGRLLLTPPWKKRRSSHTPTLEPPKNRARSGASVAANALTGAFPNPSPRKNQSGGPFDASDNLRGGVLFSFPPRKNLDTASSVPFAPPPPKRRSFVEPIDVREDSDEDERSSTLPAPPPPPPRRRAFFNPLEGCEDCDDGERSASFSPPPPPPPRRRACFDPVEGCEDGDDGERSATLPAPPPPRRRAFFDPVEGCEDGDDGERSRGRGRGGSRGRGRGVCGGRGRGVAAGPGSRARALAELIGDREPVLTPDGGPAPAQDLEEWELLRDLALNMEYEYLDGLLRRLKKLPKRAHINATERKGWIEFYTRLETCLVVRKQMRKAKCDPTPVPDQFMAEVR